MAKLKMVTMNTRYIGGGDRPKLTDESFDTESCEREWGEPAKLMLLEMKTMSQLLTEFPSSYFDKYGNFCNGEGEHLAPSYFPELGFSIHRHYLVKDGAPKDSWYYKVLNY